MCAGKHVFARVMDHLPWHGLHRPVGRYKGNRRVQPFSCSGQYRCMAFAQLTCRPACATSGPACAPGAGRLHHMGIRGGVAENTLSNANSVRDRRLHAPVPTARSRSREPSTSWTAPVPNSARLHTPHLNAAHFVLRAKGNTKSRRLHSRRVDRTAGAIRGRAVAPDGVTTPGDCPDRPRRIKCFDSATERTPVFLTSDLVLPPLTVAELYRPGWRVEPFFQVDQAEPEDKVIPRHFGGRGEEPDPDRRLRPCTGGDHSKATRAGYGSPHNSTDPGRYPVRENTVESTAWR